MMRIEGSVREGILKLNYTNFATGIEMELESVIDNCHSLGILSHFPASFNLTESLSVLAWIKLR